MAERDFSEIAKLGERYNKEPTSKIFVPLADAYRKNNMIDEALDVLNKGLEYHPQYALAHLILGKCYYDKRMYAQAEESFRKTLSIDAQNLVAYRMLAQTCEHTKNEEGQIEAYKGILAIDPLDSVTKEKLDHLAAQQKKEPLYTVSMAQEYENQGDILKALSIYEQLLFTDPSDLLLQQKVKALKERIAEEQKTEKKEKTEEKPEELIIDTQYRLDDLIQTTESIPQETQEIPPEPEVQPPTSDEGETAEPTEASVSPIEEEEPKEKKEEVLSLEEFLIETAQSPEVQASAPAQDTETQEPKKSIDQFQEVHPPQPPETSEQPSPEREEAEEQTTHQEREEPPSEALEIETAAFHVPPEIPEDQSSEEPSESTPELAQEPEPPEITKPEEGLETVEKTGEEKPVSPETEKPEEKTEPSKPKEEDFQSFKDWLSGLLK